MPSSSRRTSKRVAESPGCRPLFEMYERAKAAAARTWPEVESDFLQAMWEFDLNLRSGQANQGDNQNGKGDFFTDLIALLLENSSGKPLYGRGQVPGLFFPQHMLDASFPDSGQVEILIETKAAGAPKTDRNPLQKNLLGRPGSSDLKKRITEAGLKTIDLKAEYARHQGEGRGPAGDLVSWLRQSRPLCFLFLAIRAIDPKDHDKTVELAHTAGQMMDGVGLVVYQPRSSDDGYELMPVPSTVELDRILTRVATALRSTPS